MNSGSQAGRANILLTMLNRTGICGLLLVSLTGCGTAKPVPEDRYFRVDVPAPAVTDRAPVLRGGLLVDRLQTDNLRSGRAIVFRQSGKPLQLQRYHYRFWSEPPAKMVQHQLTRYLQQAAVASSVFSPEYALSHRYRLTGRLIEFDRVLADNAVTSAVSLEFVLTERGRPAPLLSKTYHAQSESSDAQDMHAFARATQQALAEVFSALEQDIRRLVATDGAATLSVW